MIQVLQFAFMGDSSVTFFRNMVHRKKDGVNAIQLRERMI